jgi:hypothetical protein
MSFEDSNKRSSVPVSFIGDGKRLRIPNDNDSIVGFDDIPAECNVCILLFLDVDDLANIAQVSRRFNENSLHPSLPQNRTATLTCVGRRLDKSTGTFSCSPLPLLQMLRDKGALDQYRRFNKVKIIRHNLLEKVSIPEVRGMALGRFVLPHIRVLDLSFPSNPLKNDTKLEVCIVALLAFTMPCLREIDLSNANVAESALYHFAFACPALEKITWNHHQGNTLASGTNTLVSGTALNACQRLKEIYMDNSIFRYGSADIDELAAGQDEGHDGRDYDIFRKCNTSLERVSLKNAKFSFFGPTKSFLHIGLVKFVRNTPSLRWFRSDLSPENVAILQAERPEVTFA